MTNNIVIIDYGVGNILSIKNAISINGFNSIVPNEPEKINWPTAPSICAKDRCHCTIDVLLTKEKV